MNLTVDSETSVSRRVRRRQEWFFPKGRDKVTLDKNCFILYFYSDKLSHYKTYDFRKFLIPDAFKHVRLQNTFNRCKIRQTLPQMAEYASFLVKCINYQNLMWYRKFISCKILQDSCKLGKSCKTLVIEHSFLQESYKNANASKNLARKDFFLRILQDFFDLQESCKILQEKKNSVN